MEDQTYCTGRLTNEQARIFKAWLDKEIGTEYETDTLDDYDHNDNYIGESKALTVFDLTHAEVKKIRAYDIELTKEEEEQC